MTSPLPPSADPILDPLARNRVAIGTLFAVMALLFLALSGYCFVQAFTDAPVVVEKADETKPTLKDDVSITDAKLSRPYSDEYTLGGIVGLLGALVAGAAGGWLIGWLPVPDSAQDRRTNRLLLFFVGAALGLVFMILGFVLFYLWFGELSNWLGQAEKSEPLKPLLAVLAFLLGAGLLFAGVQPLRAEERHDSLLRRIVYGSNFFLTTLLLVVGLVFVNVLATLKLPSKLDTTETGFYSLSTTTKDYVALLDQDVVIYTTIQDTRDGGSDALRVLNSFQEANPKRVKLKQLSLTLDKKELVALGKKFPTSDIFREDGRGQLGIVIALGPDEKRYQFIPQEELFGRTKPQTGGGPPMRTFQAEPRIIREILFLTENKLKPVIYFTQGAGELSIEGATAADRGPNFRTGEALKQALIADYCDVKPLTFDALAVDPQVPADATVVCIADPTAKLSDNAIRALQRYMTTPRANGTKGKLLVIAGAHSDPVQPRNLLKLGIEPLLADFGVAPQDRVAYFQPMDQVPPSVVFAGVPNNLIDEGNTIALAFAKSQVVAIDVRPLAPPTIPALQTKFQVKALLGSLADRASWLEEGPIANPSRAFDDLVTASNANRKDILEAKNTRKNLSRVLAAVSSDAEGNSGRVVIFGFSGFDDNEAAAKSGYTVPAELVGASVNWLRDRPAVANEGSKPYGVYTASAKWDWTRGVTLPVLLVILSITTVGLGLWVVRRR
jgi:ABC-type uncharacterized transport system